MNAQPTYDTIIIGGSYAGLSAAMALGRSLCKTLIIDSGKPCNRQTPHSHNFLTQDGQTPKQIADTAREQVLAYPSVQLHEGLATAAKKTASGFKVTTAEGEVFTGRKLLLATGVTDQMPAIPGFAECWGISVLHCPYCHGYEVRNQPIGLLANGDMGFELCRLISNWSNDLTLFTNGPSTLSPEQLEKIHSKEIQIIESPVTELKHRNGYLEQVFFADGTTQKVSAMFARVPFVQHSTIAAELGCQFTEHGHIQVDALQRTSISGVFAAGDATTGMRSVAISVAAGTMAGIAANKELIEENFG